MARTSTAQKPAEPALIDPNFFDRWRKARTQSALTVVGYTPHTALYADFAEWAEAAAGPDAVPTEEAFEIALRGAPRLVFEILPVRVIGETSSRMQTCASITLLQPLRSVA